MNKRLLTAMLILGCTSTIVAKKSHSDALNIVLTFIQATTAAQGIILEPSERIRLHDRSKAELARRQDARGFVQSADIDHIKKQFTAFAKTLVGKTDTVTYYAAIKDLKSRVLRTYEQLMPKAAYSAKQALWLKIKKQLIDKDLRVKAFIVKDGEVVVKRSDLEALATAVKARVTHLVGTKSKKDDRMISLGYAESKVRDLLRRSGYHNPEHVTAIMRDVQRDLKKTISNNRIAQSKLEELTVTAMKKFKRNNLDSQIMSRLAAEVKILTAIKNAKLSQAQEMTATNEMMDKLSRKSARNNLTQEYVTEVIKEILDRIKEKNDRKQKKSPVKKQPVKKIKLKKEQKKGIILEPSERARLQDRSKAELARRQDARGIVQSADIDHNKKEFTAFAKTPVGKTDTVGYYVAIKDLKSRVLSTYEQLMPKAAYSAKQALWLKIKKQLIDKDLRVKAFIVKDGEVVVKRSDLEALATAVKARVTDLVGTKSKKNDRMISLG